MRRRKQQQQQQHQQVGYVRAKNLLDDTKHIGIARKCTTMMSSEESADPVSSNFVTGRVFRRHTLVVLGLILARDPHVQFPATLTKAAIHLRGIQNGMRLLLDLPKVSPGLTRRCQRILRGMLHW